MFDVLELFTMTQSMRLRTKGSWVPSPTVHEFSGPCGTTTDTIIGTYKTIGLGTVETMSDMVVPDFYSRVRKGEVFFNPLVHTKRTSTLVYDTPFRLTGVTPCGGGSPPRPYAVDYSDGGICAHSMCLKYNNSTNGLPLPCVSLISGTELSDASVEASTQCFANIDKSSENLFEDLAELNKTAAMLRNPLSGLKKIGHKLPISQNVQGAADLWLEYKYGIKPLISAISTVLHNYNARSRRVRDTSHGKVSFSKNSISTFTATQGILSFPVTLATTDKVVVRGTYLYDHDVTAASLSGFDSKGLFTLPWELVPYSFVADWFINVQDFLASLVPVPSVTTLGSCLTVNLETTCDWTFGTCANSNPATWSLTTVPTGRFVSNQKQYTRTALSSRGLVLRSDFKLGLDTVPELDRSVTALALVAQRFGRAFAH